MSTNPEGSLREIFQSVRLGSLELKNRLVRASTSMAMADVDGLPTPDLLRVHGELARGGAGLVITDFAHVLQADQVSPADLGFYADDQIPAFRQLADVIRENGSKSCLQIGFGGSR